MNEFLTHIYIVIHKIPLGKLSTYGDIASMAGYPGYARQVGKALSQLHNETKLPWHRVVNSKGTISLKGDDLCRQRNLLLAEGIEVSETGKLKLAQHRWRP